MVREIEFSDPWLSLKIVAPEKKGFIKGNCALDVNGESLVLPIVGVIR